MDSDSDLDIFSYPCSQILLDSVGGFKFIPNDSNSSLCNTIVTLDSVMKLICNYLRNTYLFPVIFVLFSVYFSFPFTA